MLSFERSSEDIQAIRTQASFALPKKLKRKGCRNWKPIQTGKKNEKKKWLLLVHAVVRDTSNLRQSKDAALMPT